MNEFTEKWGAATTIQARARIEQDYLAKYAAFARSLDSRLSTALGATPRRAGVIIPLRDEAREAARHLEYMGEVLPRGTDPFPAGALVGQKWNEPATAAIAHFGRVADRAESELRVMSGADLPWVETPSVKPQAVKPREGERELESGETGRRPRIPGLDDLLDMLKKNWRLLLLLGVGYVVYNESKDWRGRRVVVEHRHRIPRRVRARA